MSYIHRTAEERWYLRLHDLTPYRAREILLVSSLYDAFALEEDGRLTSRLFTAYSELNLSQAPRITHAPNAAHALALLEQRSFDLVISMVRLGDMDVWAFSRQVKEQHPRLPIVLLTFLEAELHDAPQAALQSIDRVFLWTGDTRVFMAATKIIEDSINVDHDTRAAGVRVIIVVEDSVRRYSSFLAQLYVELLRQAHSLIAEGQSDLHKIMRLRARPKILLAETLEQALALFRRYKPYVSAVISDVAFPLDEVEQPDPQAGLRLARIIRDERPTLPILLQTAQLGLDEEIAKLDATYVDKNSPQLVTEIRSFLREGMGFGDFVFRLRDRTEVARARDARELEDALQRVPDEVLHYHASRHDFSTWLMARSMFRLAEYLGALSVADFDGTDELRRHLIEVLRFERLRDQEGAVTDVSTWGEAGHGRVVRLGEGSMGGKGRGLAFVNHLLTRHGLFDRYDELAIRLPRTAVIGTDEFDRFIDGSRLSEDVKDIDDDAVLLQRFLEAPLPDDLVRDLGLACRSLDRPLAVRSSSLLEDSHLLPFAGIYSTYMLPNNDPDFDVRLRELCQAVKAVYASTFAKRARDYVAGTPYSLGEEKMGVVIQQVVGQRYGERYYPHFSGVACSCNYYPVGSQRGEEGVVSLALGLGHMVVAGGQALTFSPAQPRVLPQFPHPRDLLGRSQSEFYAIDLAKSTVDFTLGQEASLLRCSLADAEKDSTLSAVGSVYVTADDSIRDNLKVAGPRVVSFNNILKWESIPLASALSDLLDLVRRGIGQEIEIELAVDMGHWGRPTPRAEKRRKPSIYIVQVRPQVGQIIGPPVTVHEAPAGDRLCHTENSLGHGVFEDIRDIVYVSVEKIGEMNTPAVAKQVGQLNDHLLVERRPYLLIGPGRWGSSDPRLGIPVGWSQISGAAVIVETHFDGRAVEPSQGSHFFHNITSRGIGYLTLDVSGRGGRSDDASYDRAWLDRREAVRSTEAVRHVQLEYPLGVYIDGRQGRATVLKRAVANDP